MSELLGADTDTLDRLAESLRTDARTVQDIRTLAQRSVAELKAIWNGPDLWRLTQQWEQQGSPQLAGASASLDTCAARLRAQSSAQREASSNDSGSAGTTGIAGIAGAAPAGLAAVGPPTLQPSPPSPPALGSPAENASWWRSLSPQQQQQVIKEHPDWIGNRDGITFTARDQANRALLIDHRGRLLAEQRRLETDAHEGGTPSQVAVAFTDKAAALRQVNDKLASLSAIDQTLARAGKRQLILLDLSPERAQAAIARGNVDTADNVAVLVPGMGTTVTDSVKLYDTTMDHLQRRAELEDNRAHPSQHVTTATVTWIGYQTPQLGWDLIGDNSVADDHLARAGAAQLAPFLQGIGAARDHDAHLSLLGHSYGSTTAGLALQQKTGVDDVVFFGSPGVGTSHVEDLLVPKGHTYYIEARLDPVGDLGYFGIDPSHMDGIEHASAKESTVVDPNTGETRHFTEVTGHSSYLDDDSTSQYNLSVIVAGLSDQRVYDDGKDFGDLLSWPIPGTY